MNTTDAGTKYWTYGQAGHPSIIMIHGFRGTHHGLEGLAKKLPDFHVIVPDLPGFGESKPLENHSLAAYIKWLDGFLSELNFQTPPTLLGHSFGSIIAAHFAAQNGNKISRLILINPVAAPALKGPQAFLTQGAIAYYFIGRKLPKKLAATWLSSHIFVDTMSRVMTKSRDKNMKLFIKDQHRHYFSRFSNADIVAESFRASVSHDVREVASRIHTPALLIVGDKDDITTLQKQKEVAAIMPAATLKIIQNVGHLIHYEKTGDAAEFIYDWTDTDASI